MLTRKENEIETHATILITRHEFKVLLKIYNELDIQLSNFESDEFNDLLDRIAISFNGKNRFEAIDYFLKKQK